MAVNTGNVFKGGLVAGLVMNVIDYVSFGVLLKDRNAAEMNALNPALAAKAVAMNSIVTGVVSDFILGIMIVWVYACVRGAYGPGPGSAVRAGLVFWVFGGLIYAGMVVSGMFSWNFYCIASVATLVSVMAGSLTGAAVYKE